MSDLVYWTETVTTLIATAILLLAIYRALGISRGLVTRVYRSRAYWIVLVMALLAFSNATSYIPAIQSSVFDDISTASFIALLFAMLLFVDTNVSVAKELDFFHRDILKWQRVRVPLFVVMVVSSVLILVALVQNPSISELWAVAVLLEFFGALGVALTYSAVTMVVIARKTYDSTMRRFVKMLAYGIAGLALFFTLWLPFDAIYPSLGDVITDFIFIGASYFFYKAVMSLTPVGRVENLVEEHPNQTGSHSD